MRLRRILCTAALALAAASGHAAAQPVQLSGQYPCGYSLVVSDVDIEIAGVQLVRDCVPCQPCPDCTFSITVYNGTITVSGLNGDGTNGTNAVAVNPCDGLSTAACPPTKGASITLRSLKPTTGPATRPLGIQVGGAGILARGGAGGNGDANPGSELRAPNCTVCAGGDALAGTAGAAGGSVVLQSDGEIHVSASGFTPAIDVSGGQGGNGANGPIGNHGGGGTASAGSPGGAAGSVSIQQNGTLDGPSVSRVAARGGDGGLGGHGAPGVTGSTAGAAGGDGGAGGSVEIIGYSPSVSGIDTGGGSGKRGGDGAYASGFSGLVCELCPGTKDKYFALCPAVGSGRMGGRGGHGGAGGPITVAAVADVIAANLFTTGGSGATGGQGGHGAFGHDDCSTADCPRQQQLCYGTNCPGVASHGQAGASGKGGPGGDITISCSQLLATSTFNTQGGCGGDGQNGHPAICVTRPRNVTPPGEDDCPPDSPCPCEEGAVVCNQVPATAGAAGGAGGNAGDITFTLSVGLVDFGTYYYCGGGGGSGGTGGDGFACSLSGAPGAGGQGGLAGASGVFSVSGSAPVSCSAPTDDCGTQVLTGGPSLPVYRGQQGASGVVGDCGCPEY